VLASLIGRLGRLKMKGLTDCAQQVCAIIRLALPYAALIMVLMFFIFVLVR
jgi:hypothetical protein